MAYLDDNGLLYFWQKIKTLLAGKVDTVSGKGLSTNDYTTAEKNKLAGLSNYSLPTASATVLGGVKVGTNLSIAEGVLSAKDTTYSNASSSTAGLMSGTDKAKLDGIASGANNYSLPTASSSVLGGVKVGSNLSINSSGVLSATNTTYSVATGSAWDALGQVFTITAISNSEIDTILAS